MRTPTVTGAACLHWAILLGRALTGCRVSRVAQRSFCMLTAAPAACRALLLMAQRSSSTILSSTRPVPAARQTASAVLCAPSPTAPMTSGGHAETIHCQALSESQFSRLLSFLVAASQLSGAHLGIMHWRILRPRAAAIPVKAVAVVALCPRSNKNLHGGPTTAPTAMAAWVHALALTGQCFPQPCRHLLVVMGAITLLRATLLMPCPRITQCANGCPWAPSRPLN